MAILNHFAVVVSDFDLCFDFFTKHLGFIQKSPVDILEGEWADKLNGLKDVKAKHVSLGTEGTPTILEMLKFINPPSIPNPGVGEPNRNGIRHMGILVEDLDSKMKEIEAAGYKFTSEPVKPPGFGVRTVYFDGPEGLELQLMEKIASETGRQSSKRITRPYKGKEV